MESGNITALLVTFEQSEMWAVSRRRQQDVIEIITSACTQIRITHIGASVLLREAGCHSACVEYITRAAKHATGGGRNRVGGQTLRSVLRLNANGAAVHSPLQRVTVNVEVSTCQTWGLSPWVNRVQSHLPLLCNRGPTSAAIMEAEKKLGPALTLVITRETQRNTLIHSVIFSMDYIHTPSPSLPGCLPLRVPSRRCAVWLRLTAVLFH